MRTIFSNFIVLAPVLATLLAAGSLAAAVEDECLGRWEGTWQGEDGMSGTFVMTLEEQADERLGGRISVEAGGSPLYETPFTEVELVDGKLTAKYANPDGMGGTVVIKGSLQEKSGAGTYSLVPEGSTEASVGGSWKAELR